MPEVEVVILAGGFGRRMGEITSDKQKCLLPIDDKPALKHIMDELVVAFGSVDAKVAVSYKAEDVKEFMDKNKSESMRLSYVPHPPDSDVSGALRSMEGMVKGPFIGLAGDVIARAQAYRGTYELQVASLHPTLTYSPKLGEASTHAVGRVVDQRVVDHLWPAPPIIPEGYYRDMNIYGLGQNIFDIMRESPSQGPTGMTPVLRYVFDRGDPIMGNVYEGPWIHIAEASDLEKSMQESIKLYVGVE